MAGVSLHRLTSLKTASSRLSVTNLRRLATSHPSKEPLPAKWVEAAKKEIDKPDADSLLWHTPEGITVKVSRWDFPTDLYNDDHPCHVQCSNASEELDLTVFSQS